MKVLQLSNNQVLSYLSDKFMRSFLTMNMQVNVCSILNSHLVHHHLHHHHHQHHQRQHHHYQHHHRHYLVIMATPWLLSSFLVNLCRLVATLDHVTAPFLFHRHLIVTVNVSGSNNRVDWLIELISIISP